MFGTVEREEKGKHREETEGSKTDFTVWFQKCKEKAKDLKVRDFCQGPKISVCPKRMEKKGKVEKGNCWVDKIEINVLLIYKYTLNFSTQI